jgi:hypothetical protein
MIKPSQVITLPIAQSQSSNKDEKGTFTSSSVYSEREMHLLVLTSGRRWVGVRVSKKSPPTSHYFYATSLNFPSSHPPEPTFEHAVSAERVGVLGVLNRGFT